MPSEKKIQSPRHSHEIADSAVKLATLAKEGIQLETLLDGPHTGVAYPTEPVKEEPVKTHTQATEKERKIKVNKLICQNHGTARKLFKSEYSVETNRT